MTALLTNGASTQWSVVSGPLDQAQEIMTQTLPDRHFFSGDWTHFRVHRAVKIIFMQFALGRRANLIDYQICPHNNGRSL
jgi:hypothetical protein